MHAAQAERSPVIIGHSMGGHVAWEIGARHGDLVRGIVTVDSGLAPRDPARRVVGGGAPIRAPRRYSTMEQAAARFRTLPPRDPERNSYIARHIADGSVRQVDGGWTWKWDPRIDQRPALVFEAVPRLNAPAIMLRGEHGIVTPRLTARLQQALGTVVGVAEIPDAGHHVMLDEPLALATALRLALDLNDDRWVR
jgi:pimeloyl-ACP methyl ester carboxylesterase